MQPLPTADGPEPTRAHTSRPSDAAEPLESQKAPPDGPLRFAGGTIDPSAYVAPGAVVVGDVTIGAESSVWFGAVLRGDTAAIRIGAQSNVQDGCVLHADFGTPCTLGDRVTLGHGAIVHGATVEDDVMVGMRAVVMNGARIGRGSIVAVGAVVTEGVQIPAGSVVMGVPGQVRRAATEADRGRIAYAAEHYVHAARQYRIEYKPAL